MTEGSCGVATRQSAGSGAVDLITVDLRGWDFRSNDRFCESEVAKGRRLNRDSCEIDISTLIYRPMVGGHIMSDNGRIICGFQLRQTLFI